MTKIITRAFPVSYRISLVYAYINFSFRHAEEVCLKSKKGHSGPFCSLQKHSFSHSTFSYPSVVLPASLPLYHPKTGRYRQHGDRHRHISASMPRHQSYRFCSVYCSQQLRTALPTLTVHNPHRDIGIWIQTVNQKSISGINRIYTSQI